LFRILDHYIRRTEGQERIIGSLLGANIEGVIEIRNTFPVPHTENDQVVAVDTEFLSNMLQLHLRANPKESIVGWYATGSDINENSVLIHDFYWRELNQVPIHLTVDIKGLATGSGLKAYVLSSLSLPNVEKPLASQFQPVKLEIENLDAEKTALEVLTRAKSEEVPQTSLFSELASFERALVQISRMLESISEYVDKVVDGQTPANNSIGRFLSTTITSLPLLDATSFEKMWNNHLQDLLMVVYLSDLTRIQIAIAERLQSVRPTPELQNLSTQ
jgi:translation initiation factor 3 subunit F